METVKAVEGAAAVVALDAVVDAVAPDTTAADATKVGRCKMTL